MPIPEIELSERLKHLQLLKDIQQKVSYDLTLPQKDSLFKKLSEKIPLLGKFLSQANTTGSVIVKAGQEFKTFTDQTATTAASGFFQFGGVALAVLDFIQIPLIYMMAFALNEKIPISLNNHAKFLYSGVLLALTIISLAVPAAAPIITLFVATVGLAVGVFSLGKTVYEYYQLSQKNKALQKQIDAEELLLKLLQNQAAELEKQLSVTSDPIEAARLISSATQLKEQFDAQRKKVEDLKKEQLIVKEKIKESGITQIIDKSVGVTFGALSIVGLVVAAYFPPVGMGILLGVVSAGSAYFVARLAMPYVISLGSWVVDKVKSAMSLSSDFDEPADGIDNGLKNSLESENSLGSVAKTFTGLCGRAAADVLISKANEMEIDDEDPQKNIVESKSVQPDKKSLSESGDDELAEDRNTSYSPPK